MSGNSESKQQSLVHLTELERKLEKLLNWAKTHTEIGLDLVSNHPIEEQNQIKRCFVRSLELGQELIGNIGNEKSNLAPTNPRVARRDSLLPLSGSSRFGESPSPRPSSEDLQLAPNFTQSASRLGCASHQVARHVPLAPSKSYSKKKLF